MGPKVRAACPFVERDRRAAVIGSIADTAALVRGEAGTVVDPRRRPGSSWTAGLEDAARGA